MTIINEVRSDVSDLVQSVKSFLFYRRESLRINRMIRLADARHLAKNDRQMHVILIETLKGEQQLHVIDKDDVARLKRARLIPKTWGMLELRNSTFYSTPLKRSEVATPEDREKARKEWLAFAQQFQAKRYSNFRMD